MSIIRDYRRCQQTVEINAVNLVRLCSSYFTLRRGVQRPPVFSTLAPSHAFKFNIYHAKSIGVTAELRYNSHMHYTFLLLQLPIIQYHFYL